MDPDDNIPRQDATPSKRKRRNSEPSPRAFRKAPRICASNGSTDENTDDVTGEDAALVAGLQDVHLTPPPQQKTPEGENDPTHEKTKEDTDEDAALAAGLEDVHLTPPPPQKTPEGERALLELMELWQRPNVKELWDDPTHVATGATGSVFRAYSHRRKELIAVKVFVEDLRWRQDQFFLRALSPHENIVQYHNHFLFSGRIWMETEFADFGNVQSMFFSPTTIRPVEPKRIWTLLYDCLNGLAHIHKYMFLHWDIKPSNVVITRDQLGNWVYKICDFGGAILAGDPREIDRNNYGTLGYAAPEVSGGSPDYKADIYALGIMILQLLDWQVGSSARSDIFENYPVTRADGTEEPVLYEGELYHSFVTFAVATEQERRFKQFTTPMLVRMLRQSARHRPHAATLLQKGLYSKREMPNGMYVADHTGNIELPMPLAGGSQSGLSDVETMEHDEGLGREFAEKHPEVLPAPDQPPPSNTPLPALHPGHIHQPGHDFQPGYVVRGGHVFQPAYITPTGDILQPAYITPTGDILTPGVALQMPDPQAPQWITPTAPPGTGTEPPDDTW